MSRRDATRGRLLPVALACLALCLPAAAQRDDKKLIARAQMSMEHQLRTCVWESRTEVTVDGQTQVIEFTRVMHDAKGVRIRAGRLPTGRSDQPLDELDKEGHQLKSALEELAESYAYMDPLKLRNGLQKATVPSHEGRRLMDQKLARGVVSSSDTVNMWLNPETRAPIKFEVETLFEGSPASVTVDFGFTADGIGHVVRFQVAALIDGKTTVVTRENSRFKRTG